MKYSLIILTLLLTCCCCQKVEKPVDINKVVIHTIEDFNNDSTPDLHTGVEAHSCLEAMFPYMITVGKDVLTIDNPVYARIKLCKDGSYLLMWQNGQIGSNIYYSKSYDLLTWEKAQVLFQKRATTTSKGSDTFCYSSADATVLSNGDILAYVAMRGNKSYKYDPNYNGIAMKRSTDNGKTWGEEELIYVGTNWEPYMLELPSGKIQCFFTDADPSLGKGSSGTSIVESTDNGKTWSELYKVIRQYKYDYEGHPIYTDQMPSVRMLSDGHTLLGFMEARLEENSSSTTSTYMMSLVYAKDEFPHLAEAQVGPQDRQTNLFGGAAGYVSVFPSGEPVISCNINNTFSMKLGSTDGKVFNGSSWATGWYQPFNGKGYWGATELESSHTLLATIHSGETIQIGRFYLNHRIFAPKAAISVDGDNSDWTADQALFIGSASDDLQTVIRSSYDDKNLYILVERSDKYLNDKDDVNIYLAAKTDKDLSKAVRVSWSNDEGFRYTGIDTDKLWLKELNINANSAALVKGTFSDGRSDSGYILEIAVPLDALGDTSNGVLLNAEVKDGNSTDSFSGVNTRSSNGWMLITKK